jgi:hypothetical protein
MLEKVLFVPLDTGLLDKCQFHIISMVKLKLQDMTAKFLFQLVLKE